MAHAPLDGTTVLDFSTVGPAARCTRILADYGARLVKIGAPPKRSGAQIQPPFYAYSGGRGVERLALDLKAPEGRDAFLRLARDADVVVESFRPGVVARLGVGYEDVRRVNAAIVYCSTSGYGQTGPYAGWAGHDLNYLALGGYLACSGRRPDGGPALPGATIADSAAGGMHAAIAILAALVQRRASGEGAYLDVSVADGVLNLMSLYLDEHLATGAEPGPGHDLLTGRYACYDVYRARDGKWLAVAAIEPAFWANLCRRLDCEQFAACQRDDAKQSEIRETFARVFATRDRDEWIAELAPADTCVSPVNDIADVARDPQLAHRSDFVQARHPAHGAFRQVGAVFAGAADVTEPLTLRDAGDSDAAALLRAAGLADSEIETLCREGIVA